jgi:hypothetical protein
MARCIIPQWAPTRGCPYDSATFICVLYKMYLACLGTPPFLTNSRDQQGLHCKANVMLAFPGHSQDTAHHEPISYEVGCKRRKTIGKVRCQNAPLT